MHFIYTIALTLMVAGSASAQDAPKIGYVDLQRALMESKAGQKAKDAFKVDMQKLQAGLKKQQDELEKLKEQLERKARVLKESEREGMEDEYRRKLRDFERSYKDSEADLRRKDSQYTSRILEAMQEIIQAYAEQENYTMILERAASAMLYADDSIDLTDIIVKKYDTQSK